MSEWAPKRFWSSVEIEPESTGYAIRLDSRPVRTPAKAALVVPTEAMAARIAAEWDAQTDVIDPATMPWTRSANAALDKVAVQREEVKAHLSGYADTDLVLYRAAGPEALVARQREQWDPIIDWIATRFGVRLVQTEGVMPVSQSPEALSQLSGAMDAMNDFQITGFHDLVTLSGSFSLALAAIEKHRDPDAIWDLSCVDEGWQIEQWGEDDEAKAVAEIKKSAFLHAAEFFHAS